MNLKDQQVCDEAKAQSMNWLKLWLELVSPEPFELNYYSNILKYINS